MPGLVHVLTSEHAPALAALWQRATDVRRQRLGLAPLAGGSEPGSVLAREGAFGVGLFDGDTLVSAAVAMPARGDGARSARSVPGLAHISSVATEPSRWGEGLGTRVTRAVMSLAVRRGYARAQLWAHVHNPAARHVYESLGFRESGLTKVDDGAEEALHYVASLAAVPMPTRPASRLLCSDRAGRILLMHWRDPHDGHRLWEPPGGGIEAGETPREAVEREWVEETGLPVPADVTGPVDVQRDMVWNGGQYVGAESFFLACAEQAGEPVLTGATALERECYLGHVWTPWEQLAELGEAVEPDVLPILRRLAPDGPWRVDP